MTARADLSEQVCIVSVFQTVFSRGRCRQSNPRSGWLWS